MVQFAVGLVGNFVIFIDTADVAVVSGVEYSVDKESQGKGAGDNNFGF